MSAASHFNEIAEALSWRPAEVVLMVWAYYDESGEYDAAGNLVNMSVGGCVSRRENWRRLDAAWSMVLSGEGLSSFHMTDFEAWAPPFDFKLENGDRDKERHNRLLNTLLSLMLDHVDGFYGYAAVSKYEGYEISHRNGMEDCVGGAVKDVVLRVWQNYEERINLVFGKQNHFPSDWVDKYVKFYDYDGAKNHIGSVSHCDTFSSPPLQTADILAYEVARSQRTDRPERYPFRLLIAGAKERGIPFSLTWGPIRSKCLNLSERKR